MKINRLFCPEFICIVIAASALIFTAVIAGIVLLIQLNPVSIEKPCDQRRMAQFRVQ